MRLSRLPMSGERHTKKTQAARTTWVRVVWGSRQAGAHTRLPPGPEKGLRTAVGHGSTLCTIVQIACHDPANRISARPPPGNETLDVEAAMHPQEKQEKHEQCEAVAHLGSGKENGSYAIPVE